MTLLKNDLWKPSSGTEANLFPPPFQLEKTKFKSQKKIASCWAPLFFPRTSTMELYHKGLPWKTEPWLWHSDWPTLRGSYSLRTNILHILIPYQVTCQLASIEERQFDYLSVGEDPFKNSKNQIYPNSSRSLGRSCPYHAQNPNRRCTKCTFGNGWSTTNHVWVSMFCIPS